MQNIQFVKQRSNKWFEKICGKNLEAKYDIWHTGLDKLKNQQCNFVKGIQKDESVSEVK
jgi:hypothetical protein